MDFYMIVVCCGGSDGLFGWWGWWGLWRVVMSIWWILLWVISRTFWYNTSMLYFPPNFPLPNIIIPYIFFIITTKISLITTNIPIFLNNLISCYMITWIILLFRSKLLISKSLLFLLFLFMFKTDLFLYWVLLLLFFG